MAGPRFSRKASASGAVTVMRCYRLLVAVLLQFCALIIGFSSLSAPAHASPSLQSERGIQLADSPSQSAPTHIVAELVVEGAVQPGGAVMLAIHMRPEKGWHGYWSNPGDAGLGMMLGWSLPAGAKAGQPSYPVPQTLLISGLMNHVYEHEYALLVPLTLPADVRSGSYPITLDAQWLACTDQICVPERALLKAVLAVGQKGMSDPRFDQWRARLPAPLGTQARFVREQDTIRIGIPLPANLRLEEPHFFAAEDKIVEYAAPQRFSRAGDLLVIELQRPKIAAKDPRTVDGLLRLNGAGDGVLLSALPGDVTPFGEPLTGETAAPQASLPLLLLLALAGGLLLNVMPCVFPILSLKALSLARSGESPAQARREGLAYTAGVVVACAALGALLLALRAGGEEVGWAFQLQEPGVVAALLLLAVAITANLLGLFEFAVPGFATEGSPQGAFATGLLAAFVATPCTGPFMAAAMGAALLLPLAPAMLLFVALGIGLALPFLAIAFVPALRRMLPKPGKWMARFKLWMALPMALTAAALLWLASRLGGNMFALAAAALAAVLVVVLALAGRQQRAGRSAMALSLGGIAAIALAGIVVLPRLEAAPGAEAQGLLPSQPFSEQALAAARASGKPVFAYFTADWCLTCKVNEEVAIEREETRAAFAKAGVVVLRGDWTRRDPAITRYLTAQGAAGVPLYMWYPAKGEARQLPQVLSVGALKELAGQ